MLPVTNDGGSYVWFFEFWVIGVCLKFGAWDLGFLTSPQLANSFSQCRQFPLRINYIAPTLVVFWVWAFCRKTGHPSGKKADAPICYAPPVK